jgi:tRNA pseudouridine55 synthase
MMARVDGVLLFDKPAGVSSHDIVQRVRREIVGRERSRKGPGKVRVGHAGTLDPFATGLLIVLLGRATRVQDHIMGLRKRYETTARFGFTSTTGDPEGEIVDTGRMPPEPLVLPTGRLRQRPPAYSAVHVDGRRAYALARAGVAVELPEREIEVHRFERVGPRDFIVECSAGTYIRTLVTELGDAYCTALRRTAIGPFSVEEAGSDPTAADVLDLGASLARFLPTMTLDGDAARQAAHGVAVVGAAPPGAPTVLLRDADGPIALATPRADGTLKPVVGFRA